jgi:hypothetical protein
MVPVITKKTIQVKLAWFIEKKKWGPQENCDILSRQDSEYPWHMAPFLPDQFWHMWEEAGKVGAEEEGPEPVLLVVRRPQEALH